MGSSVCAENQHKFHHAHQLYLAKKSLLREIEIPPRKLLLNRRPTDMFLDSPKLAEDAVFSKFLPYNTGDDDSDDPYSSDHFRMYEFKVRKCNRSRSHDWTDCPFAHPGEKARRRDPRRYHYSGTVCAEFRKGHCGKGDNCEFSHGVFECWLHPDRYRTEACKDGKNCKRKICFFAHTTRQLRYLPPDHHDNSPPPPQQQEKKYHPHPTNLINQCCVFCHASPNSTLMGGMPSRVSPPASPPISPEFHPYLVNKGGMMSTYKEKLTELMEAMNMNGGATSGPLLMSPHAPWVDVNFSSSAVDEQPQFVMSPSVPSPPGPSEFYAGGTSTSTSTNLFFRGRNLMEDSRFNSTGESNASSGPDLGWVNDLLSA